MKRTLITGLAALALISTAAWATSWFDAGGAGTINSVMHFLVGSTATPVSSSAGLPVNIVSGGGGGAVTAVAGAYADGWSVTYGFKTDAASTATDATSVSAMSVWKQISKSAQAIVTALGAPMQATGGTVGLVAGSAIVGKVDVDQTTPGTTNGVALVGVNGATALAGAGATGTGSVRVTAAQDQTTSAGATPGRTYQTVAASQTAQVLQTSTGAIGDYLGSCLITPSSTSPGVVTALDNAVSIPLFSGGASSLSNLVPFSVYVNAVSVSGAWKITTGASVTVVCTGKFS
jgi:hypothetical protein